MRLLIGQPKVGFQAGGSSRAELVELGRQFNVERLRLRLNTADRNCLRARHTE